MSESINESKRIEDITIAGEVAYSAKDLRSVAAAKRLIDPIAAEAKAAGPNSPETQHGVLYSLLGAHAIYPEVFSILFSDDRPKARLSLSKTTEAISEIMARGELPTYKIIGEDQEGSDDEFDDKARVIEVATEAMLVHPPSQDFLRDFGLGTEHYLGSRTKGYEMRVTVDDIVQLYNSIIYYQKEIQRIDYNFAAMMDHYDGLDTRPDSDLTKLQFILSMLDRVSIYMPPDATQEFKAQVQAAQNSEETTIGQLKALYIDGTTRTLELIQQKADRTQALFDAVVSGEAALYKTPETALE